MQSLPVKEFESSLMPKKSPSISANLKQMSKKELFKLAKKKKARIPQYWTKTRIIETLSTIVKNSDVLKVNSAESINANNPTNINESPSMIHSIIMIFLLSLLKSPKSLMTPLVAKR